MNIIEMAQECQLIGMRPHLDGIYQESLQKFAALVAAQEREACAGLAERRLLIEENKNRIIGYNHAVKSIVETIRARGTT